MEIYMNFKIKLFVFVSILYSSQLYKFKFKVIGITYDGQLHDFRSAILISFT